MSSYQPAILIGLGGTGTRVARLIQSFADEFPMHYGELGHALDQDCIRLLAIDTDPKSNSSESEIDPGIFQFSSCELEGACEDEKSFLEELIPKKLHRLRHHWVLLDRNSINETMTRISKIPEFFSSEAPHSVESLKEWPTIREWFPKEKDDERITQGHSKFAGAAQWRPLGRLSLFIHAKKVYEQLVSAHSKIKDQLPDHVAPLAFIVCSLAGGTGSGTFMDIALMLRKINPKVRIVGVFLLADSFESMDEAGRIFPNVYAALKEIFYLKNWKIPFSAQYLINGIEEVSGAPNENPLFDMVYLFNSFTPGLKVADFRQSVIDATCIRMSQNILSLLRNDLENVNDIGGNNEKSDNTCHCKEPEKRFGFSTCSTWVFKVELPDNFNKILIHLLHNKLNDLLKLEKIEPKIHTNLDTAIDNYLNLITGQLPVSQERHFSSTAHPLVKVFEKLAKALSLLTVKELKASHIKCDKLIEKAKCDEKEKEFFTEFFREIEQFDETKKYLEISLQLIKNLVDHDVENVFIDQIKTAVLKLKVDNSLVNFEKIPITSARSSSEVDLAGFEQLIFKISSLIKQIDALESCSRAFKIEAPWNIYKMKELLDKEYNSRILNFVNKFIVRLKFYGEEFLRKMLHSWIVNLIEKYKKESSSSVNLSTVMPWLLQPSLGELCSFLNAELLKCHENQKQYIEAFEYKKTALTWIEQNRDSYFAAAELKPTQYNTLILSLNTMIRNLIVDSVGKSGKVSNTDDSVELVASFFNTAFKEHSELLIRPAEEELLTKCRFFIEKLVEISRSTKQYSSKDLGLKYFDAIFELVNQLTLKWQVADEIMNLNSLENKVAIIITFIEKFAAFLVNKHNDILLAAGGEEALMRQLHRIKSRVMVDGALLNNIKLQKLIIMTKPPGERLDREMEKKRTRSYELISEQVFGTRPKIPLIPTRMPTIFHQDLFRSVEEIYRIHDYHESYAGANGKRKHLFHIHPVFADLPDILSLYDRKKVPCGSPKCTFDLRYTPREQLLCPGCQGPIYTRCGNQTCKVDQVDQLIAEMAQNCGERRLGKRYVPHHCPSCSLPLRTYWWYCPSHPGLPVPFDKHSCPHCGLEVQAGTRLLGQVAWRPDLDSFECDGCLNSVQHCCHQRVPAYLREFYLRGVNGHQTLDFEMKLLKAKKQYPKLLPYLCGNQRKIHYLFPTCTQDLDFHGAHHYLFQSETGKWQCTRHPELTFLACNRCHYPCQVGDRHCWRCLGVLKHCGLCSTRKGLLYVDAKGTMDRCPSCGHFFDLGPSLLREDAGFGLIQSASCPNIFGCKSRHYWNVSLTEEKQSVCQVCGEDEAFLVPQDFLLEETEKCLLCTMMLDACLPEPKWKLGVKAGVLQPLSFEWCDLLEKWYRDQANKIDHQKKCGFCGNSAAWILNWINEDHAFVSKLSAISELKTLNEELLMRTRPLVEPCPALGMVFHIVLAGIQILNHLDDVAELKSVLRINFGSQIASQLMDPSGLHFRHLLASKKPLLKWLDKRVRSLT